MVTLALTPRKDDATAAGQADIVKLAEFSSLSRGGGLIQPPLWLIPAEYGSLPPAWVTLACQLVDDGPVTADLLRITNFALMGRQELDATVAVPMVTLIDQRCQPLTSGLLAGELTIWVVQLVFRRWE